MSATTTSMSARLAIARIHASSLALARFCVVAQAATMPLLLLRLPADREQQPAGRLLGAPTRPELRETRSDERRRNY
jgi:hypothetical protein